MEAGITGMANKMNRREFTGLVAAGSLFPAKFCETLVSPVRADLAGLADDDHRQYATAPFYYAGPNGIYALWQPGIILGQIGPDGPCSVFTSGQSRSLLWAEFSDLIEAVRLSPLRSLLVDSRFCQPYNARGDFWHHHKYGSWVPLILRFDNTFALEQSGHLKKCKPISSFSDFMKDQG